MRTIETELKYELCELKKVVGQAQKRLQTVPNGFLRIKKKRDGVEYYLKDVEGKGDNGRYLRKSERGIAEGIAQRDYDIKLVKNAEERIRAITDFIEKYNKTSLQGLYAMTNHYRRELLHEAILSDEEYVSRWQEIKYTGKPHAEDAPEIITERGERVRSKSEKIIADKLYSLGIPYRYEYPLILTGNIKIYPDFTILKMPEREEVYLEHLGMMDDSSYVEHMIYKLNTYERNGIYLGVNLFITYETSKKPLNTRMLNEFIKKLFMRE